MNTNYLIKFISPIKNLVKNCFFLINLIDLRENMRNNFGKYLGINRNNASGFEVVKRGGVIFFSPRVCRIQELSK
jgi:hypothetical protein